MCIAGQAEEFVLCSISKVELEQASEVTSTVLGTVFSGFQEAQLGGFEMVHTVGTSTTWAGKKAERGEIQKSH